MYVYIYLGEVSFQIFCPYITTFKKYIISFECSRYPISRLYHSPVIDDRTEPQGGLKTLHKDTQVIGVRAGVKGQGCLIMKLT